MWTSKSADERKQDFLEAATALFTEKGYDKTSINDIIGRVGVTKGSFYYHFQSKEDVLAAIIGELSEGVTERVRGVQADAALDAPAKLLSIFSSVQGYRNEQQNKYKCLYRIMSRDENHVIASRFQQAVADAVLPLITAIISQGNAEGVFIAPQPVRTAGLFLKLSALYKAEAAKVVFVGDTDNTTIESLRQLFLFWQDTLERVLGMEKGSLKLADKLAEAYLTDRKD